MNDFAILSAIIIIPLIGILFIMLMPNDAQSANKAKKAAIWVSIFPFLLSLILWNNFDSSDQAAAFQFVEKYEWFSSYGIYYYLGVDGISLFFIVLTTFLVPVCILASWDSITFRLKEYMIFFLLLESLVVGVFAALDFVLFYLFFEAVLIPMYFIIGIWGGQNRIYASFKFFLYTLAGSVFLLLAMLYIYNISCETGCTTSIPELMHIVPNLPLDIQKWLWLAFFISFAVKVPIWPFHTWLPDAHVQAPTAGSVILAGILLKMGGYGLLRLSLPLLPEASVYFVDFVYILSVIAIVYTSLVALVQQDIKKLIAYSSVAHMGFVTLGIFALNRHGIEGGIFQMISHGLVSAALFLCVGVIYDRMHTKEIAKYSGLVNRMPRYGLIFIFFTMASVGLPGTSGFVGEMLVLIGVFQDNMLITAIAALGIILGACYMLWLAARVIYGEIDREELRKILDINKREAFIFVPLIILTLLLGVYPSLITDILHKPVDALIQHVEYHQTSNLTIPSSVD